MPVGKGRLKIGIVAHSFYPSKDGVALHTYNLARQLATLGQEIHVFTSGNRNEVQTMDGITVHRIRSFRMPVFSSLYICPGLIFELKKAKLDVIHAHGYGNFFSPIAGLYALLSRKRMVLTLHGYPDLVGAKRAFLILYRLFLAPFFLAPVKAIISVSRLGKERIEKETKADVEVIPNGVDLGRFACKNDYRKNNIMTYVGRLDEDKGVMRIASEIDPKRRVVFAGSDEGMKTKLGAECGKRGVQAEFIEVSPDEIKEVYCKGKFILLPSKYEGFPLTLLEALACKRPFISTDVGEVKAVLQELMPRSWQYLIIGDSVESAILNAEAHEKEIGTDFAEIGKRMGKYGWQDVAKRTLRIYKGLD
jgi:glycosyltransferase involved in cell wall biosynthesis